MEHDTNLEEFYCDMPAIWLVFAGSYLTHNNAPKTEPDQREKSLVDLLRSYLETVFLDYDLRTMYRLKMVRNLLEVWSQDLDLIYQIRKSNQHDESQLRRVARRFLRRITELKDCTVIPNGLISAGHTESNENINLAVLVKRGDLLDWIQVNPSGAYHQRCSSFAGDKSNAILEITEIDPHEITEDWLYLLVGLKSVQPGKNFFYKDVSLYECLLAHLNGTPIFKSEPDENFVFFSHDSPAHTWQVTEQSLRYLLQHVLGQSYHVNYRRLMTGFKLFLMKKTFFYYKLYCSRLANNKIQQFHYLLQEMCRQMAQQALDGGDREQKDISLKLIESVKTAIEEWCIQQYEQMCSNSQLNEPEIYSLSFLSPHLTNHTYSSIEQASAGLQPDPTFTKPDIQDDIVEYLKQFKQEFINKLFDSKELNGVILLSFGIEEFFIAYLGNTEILQKSDVSFSTDDIYLAGSLIELAEIYYGCQGRLVRHFLLDVSYHPQLYAKNVTIQFFVYAAVAALNFRNGDIGPVLATHNLSTATSTSLTFDIVLPHLVIDDARYIKLLLCIQAFFMPKEGKKRLFSHEKFKDKMFTVEILNDAEINDIDVAFAYDLLKRNPFDYMRFYVHYLNLENEMFNKKWEELAYSDVYLPTLYCFLFKVAFLAKASLTGFPPITDNKHIRSNWYSDSYTYSVKISEDPDEYIYYWKSKVNYKINNSTVNTCHDLNVLTSYLRKLGSYERLIIRKQNIGKAHSHLMENDIISSQDKKPAAIECDRYMHLGFLQSEPWIKYERLYIGIKERHLDFSCEQESVLIKQTLFEISLITGKELGSCNLLQWTVQQNPLLIQKLGELCVEKAMGMKYRLTQHLAIGAILDVALGLLTFYPRDYICEFIESIVTIYFLLRDLLSEPPAHLGQNTLLYLNAYLIISIQAKPQLIETETMPILIALLAIQTFKVNGKLLDNNILRRMYESTCIWSTLIEHQLAQYPNLLNDLMINIIPQWDRTSMWTKNRLGLLFTSGDYTIKPLLGIIYFQNRPITGLPDAYTGNHVFKEYLGSVSFAVIPSTRSMSTQDMPCYLSVDRDPKIRLTLISNTLLIEEWIKDNYQLYLPAQQLLGSNTYPRLFYKQPGNNETLRHWLDGTKSILIKKQQRQIVYEWDLERNTVFSLHHKGYIVPFKQLQDSYFKTWLEHIELSEWIEIIAQPTSNDSVINFQSLNFPRLGIHFEYKKGKFFSQQIHLYYLAEQQHLNTLHGFTNYLVLEKKQQNCSHQITKVVIPYRKITPSGSFYNNTTVANLNTIRSPSYFVYELDRKTGLLKANNIQAHLYLALIYFCSALLDNNDISQCNAYHLARENLEICWKDQPYDTVELDIIENMLSQDAVRDFHSHHVALYLKVVSLLYSSLRLWFLYTDNSAVQNKERSMKLLRECGHRFPHFLKIYLQNKSFIFARIRLNVEEEDDVRNAFSVSSSKDGKAYYNVFYRLLFEKRELRNTAFLKLFQSHINYFNFSYDTKGLNFSLGINGILIDRFRLEHFITLYNFAKSPYMTIDKYRYLLHHTVIRSAINFDRFPATIVMMLARALILVKENPERFPESPKWLKTNDFSVELSKRDLTKTQVIKAMPVFLWIPLVEYDTLEEQIQARVVAEIKDKKENKSIWSSLYYHCLNKDGVPLFLPENPDNFTLEYERYIDFSDVSKRNIVRTLYLQRARNNAMYEFFVQVLNQCDFLSYFSKMCRTVVPLIKNISAASITAEKLFSLPNIKPVTVKMQPVSQQPLVNFAKYFIVKQEFTQKRDFLFESKLKEPVNGYQRQFYSELKDSWLAYQNETTLQYSWLNKNSVKTLELYLQTKYTSILEQVDEVWNCVAHQFKQIPNSESDNYFALRWYSGHVPYYHKGDLIALLIEPQKLSTYNPACLQKQDAIIQDILRYVNCEINLAKIVRVLTCIEQYQQVENESEKFSLLQCIVRNLQEHVDAVSYQYPHWLVFQLENDVIVRNNQRELIVAMLKQSEKAMYQLNMGEGKSSVILPLLSYNLANGHQLLRINILSSLLITMKNFLRKLFSGLIKKRVYTLPFYRDTDISTSHLKLIFQTLQTCQHHQHILIVTPEQRLSLQLKIRELMIENQQQMGATDVFNWKTYRLRVQRKSEVYQDLSEEQIEQLLARQDQRLEKCLYNENYINSNNKILKVPPRGQGRKEFARFKEKINDSTFREWSCLKAAYRELLYNSTLAQVDSSQKLVLLNEISSLSVIDLLDESDEILRHGTELNYTIGDKYMFSGGELRWQIPQFFIQTIFCDVMLKEVITTGREAGFTVINMHYNPRGGVPFIQLLNEPYYEKRIKPLLIEKFFSENLATLRKYHVGIDDSIVKESSSSVRRYVSGQLPLSSEKKVMAFLADKGPLKDKLLIAKGWLSHGILFHVFNSKYRVQYGLDMDLRGQLKKQIAIPFWGKDTPSPRSEFSHPDVMLGFTILSYLYHGLNQQQLKDTLLRLKMKFSHQVADTLLRAWAEAGRNWIETKTETFPPLLLTSFENIDLENEQCLFDIHQYLSGNHMAILFYLNQFVLLEEAMQYRNKISANAHCLVGYDAALGFSGTDDRKLTMPFQIRSLRSATQQGTNGKLLSVLTQERNSVYYSLDVDDNKDLLKKLCHFVKEQPHCHALIDAGALITGLTNHEVSLFLIDNLPDTFLGVLHFNDEGNYLTVLSRDNKTTALQDCYLDKQYLFAYLDDVHTRGTDIKLPLNCEAILTIGIGMQKDKLMQAAMRLRQLAQKQSVSLWGTQAVTLAIARENNIDPTTINGLEVIKWVTQNTIDHINADLFPVTLRKINFQFLQKAETWLKDSPTNLDTLIQCCQENETYLLEEFYALSPQREDLSDRLYWVVAAKLRTFWQELEQDFVSKQLTDTAFYNAIFDQEAKNTFRERLYTICNELAVYLRTGYVHNSLDNDQEKEVEVEIIQEQQVVIKVESREARLENKWDVRLILNNDFVMTAEEKNIIMPLSSIRYFIESPPNLKNIIWHPDIYMTSNYLASVKSTSKEMLDNYLRPVDCVLLHRLGDKSWAIILSGQETATIKSTCYWNLNHNLLVHISDIDGPTQLPIGSTVSKQEQKLLTIIKLFSGESHYTSLREVQRIAKRVGRLFPIYFVNSNVSIDSECSHKLFGILIERGYLDFAGIITEKLLKVLHQFEDGDSPTLQLTMEHQLHSQHILKKLYNIYKKLIMKSSSSLRESHYTLWQWVGTRGRLKEYHGSALESIINSENEIKS